MSTTAPARPGESREPDVAMSPGVEGAPEPRPHLTRYLLIQADQFCGCGYNLHGQRVSFDERLEFPVVRCPECGKWHPAGHGSTALRPWLARLATVALAVWAGTLLLMGMGIAGVLIGLQFGYVSFDTTYAHRDVVSGRMMSQRPATVGGFEWFFLDTNEVAPANGSWSLEVVAVAISSMPGPTPGLIFGRTQPEPWPARAVLLGVAGLLGLVGGAIEAGAMWHLRGWRRLVPGLVVLAAAGAFVWVVIVLVGTYWASVKQLAAVASTLVLGCAAAGWLIGLYMGRPAFRAMVMGLVPPRPRMMLAFLWLADGKEPPSAND